MTQPVQGRALARIFWAVWDKLWWLFSLLILGGFMLLAITNPVLLVQLLGAVFACCGFAGLIWVTRLRRLQRQSRFWMAVPGKVTTSEVKKEIHRYSDGSSAWEYYPIVKYTYQYQGSAYETKGIINLNINWPKKEAEAAVARYPVDSAVTVFVNPEAPHQAVLEPGLGPYTKKYRIAFGIGIVFLLFGTTAWLLAPLLSK